MTQAKSLTEQKINFQPGNMVADPGRDEVYLIDITDQKLLAINTDTGQTVGQALFAGSPTISPPVDTGTLECGQMAVSVDDSLLYVALSKAQEIEVFSLPSLTPVATYSFGFVPVASRPPPTACFTCPPTHPAAWSRSTPRARSLPPSTRRAAT